LWDNFSHGFLAVSWQTQQKNYYDNQQLTCLSMKWTLEGLKWVLKSARQKWDYRNKELHQQQPNHVKELEVNVNIWEQHNNGRNGIPSASKALF